MNGRKAKALRKQVYGQMSLKTPRTYIKHNGGVKNTGLRAEYQAAKKEK